MTLVKFYDKTDSEPPSQFNFCSLPNKGIQTTEDEIYFLVYWKVKVGEIRMDPVWEMLMQDEIHTMVFLRFFIKALCLKGIGFLNGKLP